MLKTGSAALIVGVHQHSNWSPSKLSVKAKNISLMTIPYNAHLPHALQFNVMCAKSQTPKTVPEGNTVRSETKPAISSVNTTGAQVRMPHYTMCLYRYNNRKGVIVRATNWLKQVNAMTCLHNVRKTTALFPAITKTVLIAHDRLACCWRERKQNSAQSASTRLHATTGQPGQQACEHITPPQQHAQHHYNNLLVAN
ncbi:hypothetical protein TETCHI4_000107 [Candidatus Hodgkinia cicadicola]|nr:hypothetical protein TETCHI4_000107 [Candidatus Hodgkinia cicadicola]